jgi:phospholipid transport system substrate-binding protein
MMYRDNGWRVYDVVIENIGLVANYRNEFSGIIRKDKFSGLMEKLRAKVK